jgi:uncharacterized membrane protein YedE/YeeE
MESKQQAYWNPYLAGIALGVLLFLSFFILGNGLGASGALQRFVTGLVEFVAPSYAAGNEFWSTYLGGRSVIDHWLVYEVLGIFVGGFLSGIIAGRVKIGTDRGPRVSDKQRWALAFIGGIIMGYGARLARGCTSGQALSGGATLAAGSWAFMMMIFVAAYALAWFVRKQWT